MSQVRTNSIVDASGGNTATINGVAPTVNNVMGRNRIINGDMRIDQRNAGASVTLSTTTQYPVDRFPAYKGTSAATVTAQRSTTAPAGFINSIIFTASTGATPAAGDINGTWQVIEGFNVADLGWGTANAQSVTLSFWVRSSVTGTYALSLNNSAVNRFYVATYAISAANTWEYKTVTIPGDTSGTWLTDNGAGIQVIWDLGYGSNFNGSAGAWGSSTIRRTSGSVQLIATTGATFYLTGVQLEAGSVASPFERVEYGEMLQRCLRYCQQISASGALNVPVANFAAYTSTDAYAVLPLKVQMRATPTLTTSGAGAFNMFGNSTVTASTAIALGPSGVDNVELNATAAYTTGYSYWARFSSTTSYIRLSAEL